MYIRIPDKMVDLFLSGEKNRRICNSIGKQSLWQHGCGTACFDKYSSILSKNLGFNHSMSDLCIFFKHNDHGNLAIIVLMHMDDSLICSQKNLLWAERILSKEFSRN